MIFNFLTRKKLWNPEIRIACLRENDFERSCGKSFFGLLCCLSIVAFCIYAPSLDISQRRIPDFSQPVFLPPEPAPAFHYIEPIPFPQEEYKKEEKNFKPLIWRGEAQEKSVLSPETIIQCLNEVEDIFGHTIPKNLKILIIETMAIESHFGRSIGKTTRSPQGVLQIIPSTHEYVVEDLSRKEKYNMFYETLKKVTDTSLSPEENLRYNVHYGIVFFLWYMEHREGVLSIEDPEDLPLLNSIDRRWKIYKKGWNTYHRAATATKKFYVSRAREVSKLFVPAFFSR